MKSIISFSFLLVSIYGLAQGQYTDHVPVSGSDGESYALYLPETYRKGENAPILIAFAPDGVGRKGVTPFKDVADELGMIVVASNDSRNGPYERNLGIAQRLFDQVFSRYTIDGNQIVLAGFSGGSRLASTIAALSDNIAGVIACGASFSGVAAHAPQGTDGFVWQGIVGDQDFNYSEMLNAATLLKQQKYPYALQLFSGGHSWPSSEEMAVALRFIRLQLHKKGKIILPQEHIANYFKKDKQRLLKYREASDFIKTAAEYERIIAAYDKMRLTDTLITEQKAFLQSSEYKIEQKIETKALHTEETLKIKLRLKFQQDFQKPNRTNWKSWKREIAKLKKISDVSSIDQMRHRVLFLLYVMTFTGENPLQNNATQAQLDFNKKIIELLRD